MRSIILFLSILLIVSCGDKRACECDVDMTSYWENGIEVENIYFEAPNAILNVGVPLSFRVSTIIIDPNPPFEQKEWSLKTAKLYSGNQIFLENNDLSNYVKNSSIIEFPHELFSSPNNNFESGAISIEMSIEFPEDNALYNVNGSIYYYTCEDILDDFKREDCRWPDQVIGEFFSLDPC